MKQKLECVYCCPIRLYKTSNDMSGLNRELQNKKNLCGHCGEYFSQKFTRFDHEGNMICPKCVLGKKLSAKEREGIAPSL